MPRKTASNILLIALFTLAISVLSTQSRAAELLMFESGGCVYCQRWDRDVGRIYDKTEEAKVLPLRRIDIGRQSASGVTLKEPVRYTPTFVIVDKGREVGRIEGFINDDTFWGVLDDLVARVVAKAVPEPNRI